MQGLQGLLGLQGPPEVHAGHPGVVEVPGGHLHQPLDPHLLGVLVRVPQACKQASKYQFNQIWSFEQNFEPDFKPDSNPKSV